MFIITISSGLGTSIIVFEPLSLKNGEYWFPNLHDSRYFFSPSAFGLAQGEGYYGHSYWMIWQAQYGITDELSLGAGTTLWGFPSTLNAKYSFNIKEDINAEIIIDNGCLIFKEGDESILPEEWKEWI